MNDPGSPSTGESAGPQLAKILRWPALERPIMVVGMEGWIDAGLAVSNAMKHLLAAMPHQLVATFDSDELIDFRARRPTLRIVNGVDTTMTWPEVVMYAATNRTGRTVLILTGPEPDMKWHRFLAEVVTLASRFGVEMVVGLGAFPAPVPHTRPVRLVGTSTDAALAAKVGFLSASIDVPSGVQGALEMAMGEAGLPAVGLWARVPHYVAAMPYPAASAALLEGLANYAELEIDTSVLRAAAVASHQQIEQLIAGSSEHAALVRQLEDQHDNEAPTIEPDFGSLPSADELAAELERFLRGEQ